MTAPNAQPRAIIYTDGACIGNPGPGGWAAILTYGDQRKELSGRLRATTNNRMELRAAIEGLEALTRPCPVVIYTDSVYMRDGITKWVASWQRNSWKTQSKQPVKNQDLWRRLLAAIARHESAGGVTWEWVKGHAGDEYNERADTLAQQAASNVTDADPEDRPSDTTLPLFSV